MKKQIQFSLALFCLAMTVCAQQDLLATCQQRCTTYVCYIKHPSSCTKWIICVMSINRVFEMKCSRGTFFDESIRSCVHSDSIDCEFDKCKVPNTLTYKEDDDNHCKYHWKCREGKSSPACCQSGYAYKEGQGCVEDPTCSDHCESDHLCQRPETGPNCRTYWNCTESSAFESICCPPGQSYNSTLEECVEDPNCIEACPKGCPAKAVKGNNKMFMHGGELKMCPKGTLFDLGVCQCITDEEYVKGCEPTVVIDFKEEKNIASLAYVDYFPETLANGSGIGIFDGMSHLEVPYFSHGKDLDKLFLHMEFKGNPEGPNRQVLVSNCKTKETNQASLQVILDRENENILVFAYTYTEPKFFEIKYEPIQWNELILEFDGSDLKAKILPEQPDSLKVYEEQVHLEGKLRRASVPLNFGACLNIIENGQQINTHFNGEMKNIKVYTDCIPKATAPAFASSVV